MHSNVFTPISVCSACNRHRTGPSPIVYRDFPGSSDTIGTWKHQERCASFFGPNCRNGTAVGRRECLDPVRKVPFCRNNERTASFFSFHRQPNRPSVRGRSRRQLYGNSRTRFAIVRAQHVHGPKPYNILSTGSRGRRQSSFARTVVIFFSKRLNRV